MSQFQFTDELANQILTGLSKRGITIDNGLTKTQFGVIEDTLRAVIPTDLKRLLSHGVPVDELGVNQIKFPQWNTNPLGEISESKLYIQKAFEFDIRENEFWTKLFGNKPNDVDEAVAKALKVVDGWPPLIRIYGHRYMPTMPNGEGNPIISIWQASDTIYYGKNLVDYFSKEFKLHLNYNENTDKISIPFWGEAFDL